MFKIEFQHWNERKGNWRKGKHKFYEKEETFEKYWEMHRQYYFQWGFGGRRLVAFKNGKVFREIYE